MTAAGVPGYQRLWLFLCLGWVVSSADRAVTGPVVTWMIAHHAAFMSTADPYTTGGLVGSIFFAGYMLTQFPGGYAGDRHGHRSVIVISLLWAALATLVSGLAGTLAAFIAARILTGLGEGAYYANDRSVIAETTPPARISFAMGVVITGLSIGITLATIGGAWLLALGQAVLGEADAWRMPFFVLAAATGLAGWAIRHALGRTRADRAGAALGLLARYAAPSFMLVFGAFLLARWAALPAWGLTLIELALAFGLIGFILGAKGEEVGAAVRDRDLLLLYVSFIPILWNLWFIGFWAIAIVSASAGGSFTGAAATAMFTGLSGLVGYPLGGWIADRAVPRPGRKAVLLTATLALAVLTIALAAYLQSGGHSAVVLAALLFSGGLFFNALQPVSHAMVASLAPPDRRGAAFGAYNLVGEIGAVLAPTVSGVLRDATGGWSAAVYVDGALILASAVCVALVRERAAAGTFALSSLGRSE